MGGSIGGLGFMRAVGYAARACPRDDARARLGHVVFLDGKVIASDGHRWHVGLLPPDAEVEPMAVSRLSVRDLMLGLDYARRMSRNGQRSFEVQVAGPRVTLKFGKEKVVQDLDVVEVGALGPWSPPVGDEAPAFRGDPGLFRCQHLRDAMSWYRSWERDYGEAAMFGAGDGSPLRCDVRSDGDLVVQAYLLPTDHAAAQLPEADPLFNVATDGRPVSQAVTSLRLAGRGPKAEAPAPARKPRNKKAQAAPEFDGALSEGGRALGKSNGKGPAAPAT